MHSSNLSNKYLSFDQSIHQTMADYNLLPVSRKLSTNIILDILNKNWISKGYESYAEETKFKARACNVVLTYFTNPLDIGLDMFVINKNLGYSISREVAIFAKVDKVYERFDGNIEIVDYKSGYLINHIDSFPIDLRTAVLLKLVYLKIGIYADYISYYYLNYNKKFIRKVSSEDIYIVDTIINKLRRKR